MKKNILLLVNRLTIKSLLVACLFLAFLFVFAFIANEAVYENEVSFDKKIMHFLSIHSSATTIEVMRGFTFLGSFYFLLPAYGILIGHFLIRKKNAYAINIFIMAVSSTIILFALKQLFHRQRPLLPLIKDISGYSFPSGHALSAFIFCSIVCYIIGKGSLHSIWKWIFILLLQIVSVTIGISRIVLNVHYATDVMASFCLGIAWVMACFAVLKKWD